VKWNDQKVLEWARRTQGWDEQTTRRNILDAYDVNSLNATEFDPDSIMLYFFPPEMTVDNKGTKPNFRLSRHDVEHIHAIYQGAISPNEFYQRAYGVNIDDSPSTGSVIPKQVSPSEGLLTFKLRKSHLIWIGVVILLVLILRKDFGRKL
jgi:hypothetical protein